MNSQINQNENFIKPITTDMLRRVSKSLYNRTPGSDYLLKFISDVDGINTLGCFTSKGIDKINSTIYSDPFTQEFILNVLSNMYELFLQEAITLEDMSYYVSQLYRPIMEDSTLKETYVNIMPKYNNSILTTYGAVFVEVMIFKSLVPHLLNEHVAYSNFVRENDPEIKKVRKEYMDKILGNTKEGEDNEKQ